jgi:hypothetical protein
MSKIAFPKPKNSIKKIEMPELESPVYICRWSAAERMALTREMVTSTDTKGNVEIDTQKVFEQQIRFLQIVLCDEKGIRKFNDTKEDYEDLSAADAGIIEYLWTEAWKFNNVMDKKAQDDAIKNSETSQT